MSFSSPALSNRSYSVVGEEAEFVKMFDPPGGAARLLPEHA